MSFVNREDAGRRLAKELMPFASEHTVVLALPRGGVVLGAEVARMLKVPLGIVQVRKISHPTAPEFALGAIADNEPPVMSTTAMATINDSWLREAVTHARAIITRRRKYYFGGRTHNLRIRGQTALIVDDGIATGLTFEAAVRAVRKRDPIRIIGAVPVASPESVKRLRTLVDTLIVLEETLSFRGAVSAHYQTFEEVNDDTVVRLLREVKDDVQRHTARGRVSPQARSQS